MTLKEALLLRNQAGKRGEPYSALLACGYSPLHLETFLTAHLAQALPDRAVSVSTGLFGDLAGTLAGLTRSDEPPHALVVSIEWPDLDPRLGYRRLGGWNPADIGDIAAACRAQLDWIASSLADAPAGLSIAVAGPTLDPAPAAQTPGWFASAAELELRHLVAEFLLRAARNGARVLDPSYLDRVVAPDDRFDAKSELGAGFPFTRQHAAALAEALARLALPDAPKKGLITDLDNTLWRGVVGEVGAENIAWDLDGKAQIHGLYQQMLASLSAQGTLLAIASKNDPANVEAAFQRPDIRIPLDAFFPAEIHWDPKSGSVGRILETWNIGADAAVFLDDSPAELAEVQAEHPGIECILFPKDDPAAAIGLLRGLRDRFGKTSVSAEDSLRLESLRNAAALREASDSSDALDRFLASAEGAIAIDPVSSDARSLELVNKTNQFNLNGVRYTEADWAAARARPAAFTYSFSYEDKFGPLGKVAVLHGRVEGNTATVETWVMSCRAFSRRIEYHALRALFDRLGVESIAFRFEATPKNGPIASFLRELAGESLRLSEAEFASSTPALYHRVSHAE